MSLQGGLSLRADDRGGSRTRAARVGVPFTRSVPSLGCCAEQGSVSNGRRCCSRGADTHAQGLGEGEGDEWRSLRADTWFLLPVALPGDMRALGM